MENKIDHVKTYYAVEVGKGAGGGLSLLMPLSNDDNLPMRYVTQRTFANGRTEAGMVMPCKDDKNAVVKKALEMLRDSPHFTIVKINCAKLAPPNEDSWRVTIYSDRMSAEEMIEAFDRGAESSVERAKLSTEDMNDIAAFLRSQRE